ncbi:MAG: hypothetical protein JJ959_16065 [Nisaea sp.]|uniref:hypothetical protein n=1 Tax=Nisaea sp. TaxID=2024842 RepID=UPI001B1B1BD7|nr:hypothetical protein [Nisaea sp.]MBO6562060.1 hypothetical protein [Nisaea sp.]
MFSLLAVACGTAFADPVVLSEDGARLAQVNVDSASVSVEIEVSLGGDQPTANYVSARTGDGDVLQRTNLGYWIPWDGRLDSLVDNHSPVAGNVMKVKVFRGEDLRGELFPIRVTIAYETASSFKFGVVELVNPGTH